MKISYRNTEDVLYVQLSDAPVVKDVSYGEDVNVGYDADGQLVEITILDLSSVLAKPPEENESTLVLTERESRRLLELMESPPPRSERFLAARARYHQHLEAEEPAIENNKAPLEPVLSETVSDETTESAADESEVSERSTCITHITPVGGNIFLDLGFPPEEAERLKEESDRRISSKKGRADKNEPNPPFPEIPFDEVDRPEPPEGYPRECGGNPKASWGNNNK